MKRQVIGLALTIALFGASQTQATVIDTFNDVEVGSVQSVTANPATAPGTTTPAPNNDMGLTGAVGGNRTLAITGNLDSLGSPGLDGATLAVVTVNPLSTELRLNNTAHATSVGTVVWDGDTDATNFGSSLDDGVGSSGVDLGTASDYIIWRLTSLDIPLLVQITLKDADGTIASNTFLKLAVTVGGPNDPDFRPVTTIPEVPGDPDNIPGNLYHGLGLFQTGGTDPATDCPASATALCVGGMLGPRADADFFDRIADAGGLSGLPGAGAGLGDPTLAANMGADGMIDLDQIVAIAFTLDTTGAGGSDTLNVAIDCLYTGSGPTGAGSEPNGALWDNDALGANPNLPGGACNVIPEPSTVLLMGTGLLGVALFGVRSRFIRRRQQA